MGFAPMSPAPRRRLPPRPYRESSSLRRLDVTGTYFDSIDLSFVSPLGSGPAPEMDQPSLFLVFLLSERNILLKNRLFLDFGKKHFLVKNRMVFIRLPLQPGTGKVGIEPTQGCLTGNCLTIRLLTLFIIKNFITD